MIDDERQPRLLSLDGLPKITGQLCRACYTIKPWSAFERNPRMRMGYIKQCNDCRSAYFHSRHLTRWHRHIANGARTRSRETGVPFEEGAIEALAIPERCPILGIKLEIGNGRHDGSPSVDRIVPSLGYVRGNLRVISFRANRIKSDISDPAELEAVIAYMRRETERAHQ